MIREVGLPSVPRNAPRKLKWCGWPTIEERSHHVARIVTPAPICATLAGGVPSFAGPAMGLSVLLFPHPNKRTLKSILPPFKRKITKKSEGPLSIWCLFFPCSSYLLNVSPNDPGSLLRLKYPSKRSPARFPPPRPPGRPLAVRSVFAPASQRKEDRRGAFCGWRCRPRARAESHPERAPEKVKLFVWSESKIAPIRKSKFTVFYHFGKMIVLCCVPTKDEARSPPVARGFIRQKSRVVIGKGSFSRGLCSRAPMCVIFTK